MHSLHSTWLCWLNILLKILKQEADNSLDRRLALHSVTVSSILSTSLSINSNTNKIQQHRYTHKIKSQTNYKSSPISKSYCLKKFGNSILLSCLFIFYFAFFNSISNLSPDNYYLIPGMGRRKDTCENDDGKDASCHVKKSGIRNTVNI